MANAEDIKKYLLLFFERPIEPCLLPKGKENFVFNVPSSYYPKYYESLKLHTDSPVTSSAAQDGDFAARYSDSFPALRIIDIHEIDLPDLSVALELDRFGQFSVFLPRHREMAARLVNVFMGMRDLDTLLSISVYCQLHINPFLFVFSLSIALLHRPDTKGIELPGFADIFPDMFVDKATLHRARLLIYSLPKSFAAPIIVNVDPPKVYLPEQRVAYFRDDYGINSHHWHWHLIYPGFLKKDDPSVVVNKDRRGELFYYMHHQIVARYNAERLSNELERVKPFDNFREIIADGVYPKMNTKDASQSWIIRFDNVYLQDVDRSDFKCTIDTMDTWRNRIMEAIKNMAAVKPDGTIVPLDEENGIDILGNMVEPTMLSVNENFYGKLHNNGHNMISLIHDPNGYQSEAGTIMGDTATAIRDPIFYRWHAFIDEVFLTFKDKLPPYPTDQLVFPKITVSSIKLRDASGIDIDNTLSTMWESNVLDLSNGLDFNLKRPVYARLTYLQHEKFKYVIEVNNKSGKPQKGTFRIFMAPVADEKGKKLSFEEQRKLMIEMDKFAHELTDGENTIERYSSQSSVTVPYERILRGTATPTVTETENVCTVETKNAFYCDCGWPQNMLLPRGDQKGYPMVLFVMISDWNVDRVDQDEPKGCKDNASYCGLRDRKYPDRRAMGYPFDRRAPTAPTLEAFLKPNMATLNLTIKFNDIII